MLEEKKKKTQTQADWEQASSPWLLSPVCWAAQRVLHICTAQPKGLGQVDILVHAAGCLSLCMPEPGQRGILLIFGTGRPHTCNMVHGTGIWPGVVVYRSPTGYQGTSALLCP